MLTKFNFITIFTLAFLVISCNGQQSGKIQTIDAKSFAEKLHSTNHPQLIDVRTPEEYSSDKIENAKNLNWNDVDFESNANKLDKTKPVFVYCKAGGRSTQAANKLAALGFTEIYNLEGGIMKWNAAGLAAPKERIGMTKEQYQDLLKSDKKVLIDFSAKWCGPCQKMAPYLEKMKTELSNKVLIIKIDADQDRGIVEDLGINALPTLILYENGQETWKNVGFISEEDLKKHL